MTEESVFHMPKLVTFPTSNSAVPFVKTICRKLLSFILLSVLNNVCKISIIPLITKQNSVQVSN